MARNEGIGGTRVHIVRNRDIAILEQVKYVMQELYMAQERLDWQRAQMFKITSRYGGIGGGRGAPKGLETAVAALEECNERYLALCVRYRDELKAADEVLDGIHSRSMRTFVEMKYMYNEPNRDIMEALGMTDYAFRSAREAVERAVDMAHVKWTWK